MSRSDRQRRPVKRVKSPPPSRRWFGHAWDELSYLSEKMRYWMYEDANRTRARRFARQAAPLLKKQSGAEEALLGQLLYSMFAELGGDVEEAIERRDRLLRMLYGNFCDDPMDARRVAHLFADMVSWITYGRLAELYQLTGDTVGAIRVLTQAKAFCEQWGYKFESAALLRQLQRSQGRVRSSTH